MRTSWPSPPSKQRIYPTRPRWEELSSGSQERWHLRDQEPEQVQTRFPSSPLKQRRATQAAIRPANVDGEPWWTELVVRVDAAEVAQRRLKSFFLSFRLLSSCARPPVSARPIQRSSDSAIQSRPACAAAALHEPAHTTHAGPCSRRAAAAAGRCTSAARNVIARCKPLRSATHASKQTAAGYARRAAPRANRVGALLLRRRRRPLRFRTRLVRKPTVAAAQQQPPPVASVCRTTTHNRALRWLWMLAAQVHLLRWRHHSARRCSPPSRSPPPRPALPIVVHPLLPLVTSRRLRCASA